MGWKMVTTTMWGRRHNTLVSLLLLLLLLSGGVVSLHCYECDNELTNNFCISDLNLKTCDPGLDTCQTIVSYSGVSEKLSIIKTCSVNASCHIQKQESVDTPCDKSLSNWICTSCCYEDGCNISGQMPVRPQFAAKPLVVVALIATTYSHLRDRYLTAG